jgi:hypothetical protein
MHAFHKLVDRKARRPLDRRVLRSTTAFEVVRRYLAEQDSQKMG